MSNQVIESMLAEEIKSALKNDSAILGYRESVKFIKLNQSKLIVVSNNIPENMRKELEHVSSLSNSKLEIFDGNSREMGTFCGKPFPVSVIAIKG